MIDPFFWLFYTPVLLISLTVHEFSHGFVAWLCGDPTPKYAGRLTLNPLKHLDLLGTLTLFLTQAIGWAKPVPINPNYFRNPWRDMALVAVAGPLSNLILALLFAFTLQALEALSSSPSASFFQKMLYLGARVNLALSIFNLLPIPPLDGSKVIVKYLPREYRYNYLRLEMIGFLIILFLALTGILHLIINPILNLLMNFILYLTSLPFS
ncbi:MAG: site-2 protease family protein [Caldimicrobium sp.]|jgi:Zn-dependent protease|nr:site-2 protease family protein [Caldimicrobium sp.]